ncbi:hypothetical protein Pint_08279 [Pistacia integerrima]|uniref:Uncharacterized protein n=1 Tax=Pistacia integerrima TaxID=434235 RepID=A0ACC0XX78_9ROSI|nr:hypothetical protein Pint_08279 [Pistacia integerrima]
MASPGSCLAEAYVLRKMQKEKMKKEERGKIEGVDSQDKNSSGCFLWKVKKVHSQVLTTDYSGKEVEQRDNEG